MTDRNQTDRIGVNAVEAIFLKDFEWIFREQPVSDYGIDAQVEIKKGAEATGQLLALQIKTGPSWFRKRGDGYVYYGVKRHLEYWMNHSLPVFIILHDPETDRTIWQKVEQQLIEEAGDDRWLIPIPATQVLDKNAVTYFERGISSDPYSMRRSRLAFDLPIIKAIAEQEQNGPVFAKLHEWVNKGLNFRGITFHFDDDDVEPAHQIDFYMPSLDLREVMRHVAPWLKYEYSRAIEDFMFEVHVHTFAVELNEIGISALVMENYFANGADIQEEADPKGLGHEPDYDDPTDWEIPVEDYD